MIGSLRIRNFKCFKDERFELRPLNIFCGQNGVGKSSAIQTLLLIREASSGLSNDEFVRLNGPSLLELGTVADVFYHNADDTFIEFTIEDTEGQELKWMFPADNVSENQYLVLKPDPSLEGKPSRCLACFTSHQTSGFTYICADRHGPQDTQGIQSSSSETIQVGVRGEFTAEVLAKLGQYEVRERLLCPQPAGEPERSKRLARQIEFWMRGLIPGIEIRSQSYPDTNVVTIRLKMSGKTAEWSRPANIGFGVSHGLPIIVAGLLCPPESLFILDSPESHLHPAAQAYMARFLATLAAGGVQVIVETHSDHIINGIRLAAIDNHPLDRKNVIIHNFCTDSEGSFQVMPIEITATGSLSEWPRNFLDQTERDLAAILKARKEHG